MITVVPFWVNFNEEHKAIFFQQGVFVLKWIIVKVLCEIKWEDDTGSDPKQ